MKVLHLDTGKEWRGGQQQVLYLTQGLEERGVVSVAAAPQGSPLAIRLRRENLPLIELPPSSSYSPRSVRALQNILADRSWDVLHAHTSHAHSLGFLTFRLPPRRPFRRPAFVISRRVDFTPARDPLTRLKYTSGEQTYICVSHAIAGVLQTYGVAPSALRTVHSGVPVPPDSLPPEAETAPREPASPVPSPDRAESASPFPNDAPPGDREQRKRDLRAELGIPDTGLLIGTIAQFVGHKGHRYLLEAMPEVLREVPEARLVLFGSGELERDLQRQVQKLSLGEICAFAGYRPDAVRFLPALDLFVLPSVEEGLGTSILDAQAAGVAVVGTQAGGIPEAVEDGASGLLVRPADAGALAGAIRTLLRDPARRAAMGRSGRERVRETFSVARMVEETLAVYRELSSRV